MKSPIRRWIQVVLLAIGAVGLAQCVDSNGPSSELSTIGVAPVWGSEASHTLGVLDEGGFPLDRVRIILVRPVSDTLKDTTITMRRSDAGIDLPLTVRVVPGVLLEATLQFKSGETLLYEGKATVETVPLNRFPRPVDLPMQYLGPGKDASRVVVTPSSGAFPTTASVTFSAAVFNPADVQLPGTPLAWTVDDATMGEFIGPGVFSPSNKGGSVTVTATTPTGVAGSATVTLEPPGTVPASIAMVSGDAQSGTILEVLQPFVVKVTDVGAFAVPGVVVTWTRTSGFGTPASGTSTTDASGFASFSYRLGDLSGTEVIVASVAGLERTVTFTATAIPGDFILPVVTGFAYLRVMPSPASPRVGDTLSLTADSISATGQATPVAALWASSNPGRGSIDANGRLIVADTGEIIITATRNGMVGHARVGVLPAPMLTGFSFAPRILTGITNSALSTSFTFAANDAGTGVTSATLTLTAPDGTTTKTCTFGAPTTGTAKNGVFDCAFTLPAGSQAGVWHVTSLTINGSVTRTYGESVLALFSPTTLTINP